uniref:WD_REPEATS_REGION domain-containing protein n=1 Tax=Globodera rostochiensis TaxID=31243 RepID=A0A914GWP8_GLORO
MCSTLRWVLISQPQLFFTVGDDETVRVWYLNNSNNIDHRQNTAAVHRTAAEIGSSICSTSINIWYGQIVRYVVCNPGTVRAVDQAQKLINDLLAICLEMLCTRTKFFSMESQRTIIQIVLVPLIEKGAVDKMWRTSSKCRKRLPQAKSHFPSNNNIEQLIDYQQPNQGVLVLIKLFSAMEQLLFANAELQRHFMNATTRAAKK